MTISHACPGTGIVCIVAWAMQARQSEARRRMGLVHMRFVRGKDRKPIEPHPIVATLNWNIGLKPSETPAETKDSLSSAPRGVNRGFPSILRRSAAV